MAAIDVRTLPPGARHQRVLEAFERMQVGETLELIAPHEPHGVHLDFEDLYRGTFRWLASPPDPSIWRVQVQKIANTSDREDVEVLAANDALSVTRVLVPAGGSVSERRAGRSCAIVVTAGIVSCIAGETTQRLEAGGVTLLEDGVTYALTSEDGASALVIRSG